MSDIFISYARADKSRVEPLAGALAAYGWSVWWDPNIPTGAYFDEAIEQALKDAKCIVVVWSKNSESSRWVRAEAAEGAERGIIVPVLIEDAKVPIAFKQIQTARLIDWDGSSRHAEFKTLVRDISALLGPPPATPADTDLPAADTKPSSAPREESEQRSALTRLRRLFEGAWRKAAIASAAAALLVVLVVWAVKPSGEKIEGPRPAASPGASPTEPQAKATPKVEEPSTTTPDFTSRQGYLNAAPEGIDARYAWTLPGGGGEDVHLIFIGGTSKFSHEDLNQPAQSIGPDAPGEGWRSFEVAILGVIGGKRNGYGITGICPDATLSTVSAIGSPSAIAITKAADMLRPGDIILVQVNRPGPPFAIHDGDSGLIPVEWWPDDFAAISYATRRGVIVVEAAGDGAKNLDDSVYEVSPSGESFPASWQNPFRRKGADSGAIVVGAGAPPPDLRGQSYTAGPDRARADYSNYGSAVDAQGWGREVTTTGYGDLQGGSDEARLYTDKFSGTGSASAIVAGALGCVQGVLRARGLRPLSPKEARDLLRSTGSPQEDSPERPRTQRIGSRPDLRQLIPAALALRR